MRPYLASGVDDIAIVLDTLVLDTLGENVLDRWIVRIDEVALSILDDKRGLPCRNIKGLRGSSCVTWG